MSESKIQQDPMYNRPVREPNCKPGDPVDASGLVHAWELVSEDGPGDVYHCPRCGQTDFD
jgi:hypothetical protein